MKLTNLVKRVTKVTLGLGAAVSIFAGSAFAADNVVLDGSTTVGPIAKAFAEYYMELHPEVNVTVAESGSGNGAKSLINNACDIANMSRGMKDKEFKAAAAKSIQPCPHVVALDGLAIAVHPSNPVKAITMDQIKDIYLGKITNWKQLGGMNSKIVMITRDTNSGTFETFHKLVMKKAKIASGAETVGSNGAARQRIQTTPGAIGYIGIGFVDRTVKDIPVNGVKAEQATIVSGKYPIARPLYMYTNGYPKLGSNTYNFINLYMTPKGQEIIEEIGFIPLTTY